MVAGPEEVALMRRLKQALDPGNILNPGKVLAPSWRTALAIPLIDSMLDDAALTRRALVVPRPVAPWRRRGPESIPWVRSPHAIDYSPPREEAIPQYVRAAATDC